MSCIKLYFRPRLQNFQRDRNKVLAFMKVIFQFYCSYVPVMCYLRTQVNECQATIFNLFALTENLAMNIRLLGPAT